MKLDANWLLWNEIPKNLSSEEYQFALQLMKDMYKSSFIQLNQNQAAYNQTVQNLKDSINALEEALEQKKIVLERYQTKFTKGKLSFKERLLGCFDISKLTK